MSEFFDVAESVPVSALKDLEDLAADDPLEASLRGSRPLEWCIDGHSVISSLRLCGELGGQGGVVGF
ncbi:hypothetical protein [Streptomyces sp. I6]|uniref:hypothetical protein n=1 Tax=Streptomyces sp. I6 TaxID=2483113 RepID=UPI00160F3D9D|nr:hypothetical protein [Streptomyces sp. I6]